MTADTVGGVFTYSLELCRGLAHHGVEVVLATMGARLSPAQRAALAALENVQVYESEYRLEWMDDPWRDVEAAGAWLMELAAVHAPDVIHLNGYAHAALPWRAPVLVVAHSCVLSWWQAVKREDAPPAWDTYRQRVAAGVARADRVVAPTRAMLDAVARLYGRRDRSRVIHNGRSAPPCQTAPRSPLVFSAGRLWDEAKNLAALAACAPDLPWPVYVAGPTRPPGQPAPSGQPGRHDAACRGLHLLGTLAPQAMNAWLARAAIYALPARYEPFGLSVLEAAQAGCALVLGEIDSLREAWGNTALFVPPDDPEALGHAITTLVRAPIQRALMAERARARAGCYTTRGMTRAYLEIYAELGAELPAERRGQRWPSGAGAPEPARAGEGRQGSVIAISATPERQPGDHSVTPDDQMADSVTPDDQMVDSVTRVL
jgi:glycosyltransferase involved in cell wall biosynthesis